MIEADDTRAKFNYLVSETLDRVRSNNIRADDVDRGHAEDVLERLLDPPTDNGPEAEALELESIALFESLRASGDMPPLDAELTTGTN